VNHRALYIHEDGARRHARTLREAFREWPENAIGITGPVVIPLGYPWWVRAIRFVVRGIDRAISTLQRSAPQ